MHVQGLDFSFWFQIYYAATSIDMPGLEKPAMGEDDFDNRPGIDDEVGERETIQASTCGVKRKFWQMRTHKKKKRRRKKRGRNRYRNTKWDRMYAIWLYASEI